MADPSIAEGIFAPDFLYRNSDLQNFILAMLKGGLTKQARDQVGEVAANFVRAVTARQGLTIDNIVLSNGARDTISALQSDGYALIPSIFLAQEIAAIYDYIADKPVSYFVNGFDGSLGQRHGLVNDLPRNNRFSYYLADDISRCPILYRAANNPDLVRIAARYLETPPTISTMSLWWSFPSEVEEGGMQAFHHDRGDFRSCNLFVYLTDVAETGGPHAFVKNTHSFPALKKWSSNRYAQDPRQFQAFWQWMENHRKPDEQVRAYFPDEQIQTFVGPKGTCFFEDTRGLHRAVPPQIEPRLVFEIVYSTLPKFNEAHAPIPRREIAPAAASEPDSTKIDPMVRYATRLLYT
jgi:hypothetical protein